MSFLAPKAVQVVCYTMKNKTNFHVFILLSYVSRFLAEKNFGFMRSTVALAVKKTKKQFSPTRVSFILLCFLLYMAGVYTAK